MLFLALKKMLLTLFLISKMLFLLLLPTNNFWSYRKTGPGVVTAGDIQISSEVEIVNPDLVIATLGEKAGIHL